MDDLRRRQEQALSSREERKCVQNCSMQLVFTVRWKNGKIAKSLGPSQKGSGSS